MPRLLSKVLSLLLGLVMLMFGVRKFFEPIRSRFELQIQQSHLPHEAILVGKVTETLVGLLFLLPWFGRSLSPRRRGAILLIACFTLSAQMLVVAYVHLQPGVPASSLPLHIKRPIVPITFLLLAVLDALLVWKQMKADEASEMANR